MKKTNFLDGDKGKKSVDLKRTDMKDFTKMDAFFDDDIYDVAKRTGKSGLKYHNPDFGSISWNPPEGEEWTKYDFKDKGQSLISLLPSNLVSK